MVIGKKEVENKSISVRRLGNEKTETFKIQEITNILFKESLPPSDI